MISTLASQTTSHGVRFCDSGRFLGLLLPKHEPEYGPENLFSVRNQDCPVGGNGLQTTAAAPALESLIRSRAEEVCHQADRTLVRTQQPFSRAALRSGVISGTEMTSPMKVAATRREISSGIGSCSGAVAVTGLFEQQRIADAFLAEGLIPRKVDTLSVKLWAPKGS